MSRFDVVSGERSDGSIFICDGFVYKISTTNRNKGKKYLKCSEESSLCPGSAVIRSGEPQVLIVNKPHCHPPMKVDEEVARYRNSLRMEATNSLHACGFRNIFDRQSARYPVGSLLRGFPQDEQIMRRSRNRCFPPTPTDLENLHDILNFQPEWRNWALAYDSHLEFFRETVQAEDGSRVSVLVSPYFADALCLEGAELYADGTFDCRPLYPTSAQLLSVHVSVKHDEDPYCFPCAYVLMEKKSEAAYKTAFQTINVSVGNKMKPASVMADYEKALHKAVSSVFPGVETSGCWFHYCNALHTHTCSLGLTDLLAGNEFAEKAVQKCMALPLLPPGEIVNGMAVIEEELHREGLSQSLSLFIKYIKMEWLDDNKVGVNMLSVFELDSRTNNSVENSHYMLFKKLNVSRPNFWIFYDALRMFDFARHQDRQRLLRNVSIRRPRRRVYITQDDNIRDMQSKLAGGILSVSEFLERACHTVEGLQKRFKGHDLQRGGVDDYGLMFL